MNSQQFKKILKKFEFLLWFIPVVNFFYLTKKYYFSGGKCKSKTRLDGKTVIVTGANTGMGKEVALDMARRGARVIMAGHHLERVSKAADKIRKETGNGNIVVEIVDLASFDSIRQFCSIINSREERIDVLINNAGVMACPKWRTKDGFEMQFGVNYLGHFLLTNLLLDKIKKSAPSRIVNVASIAYIKGKINWDDINLDKSYGPIQAYCNSKLAVLMFSHELAKKLKGSNVSVFSIHPGAVRTKSARYLPDTYGWIAYVLIAIAYPFTLWLLKSPKDGAQTTIYCAVEESIADLSGGYFRDCKQGKLLPHALDDDDSKKLWDLSEKFTHLK